MTNAGRGFGIENYLSAAILLPESNDDFYKSFIIALHEFTHHIIDALLNCEISIGDTSHDTSESVVLYADYLLIKKYHPKFLDQYFKWICEISGNNDETLTEDLFNQFFILPFELTEQIKSLTNKI
jgi:hypothetical protein